MYYVYILYTEAYDKYYIGSTQDVATRVLSHNSSELNTFTSKYRPWRVEAYFGPLESRTEAMKYERIIKSMKQRRFIRWLVSSEYRETERFPIARVYVRE